MTKEAPGGRAFHSKILWCPAWAGVREGGGSPPSETARLEPEPRLVSKVQSPGDETDRKER